MNTKTHSVLVQTDKSIYKPSDKVQFRILVLNADLKPLKKSKVQVHISDGAQNRVKQFDDINLSKGFFQNELQLSDSPVLGIWKIHVKVNGDEEVTKEFEVAEYTLPKFEVAIDTNPDANFKDGKIRATVKAKYTFGKIAKGNATVTAEVVNNRWWWRHEPHTEVKVSKSIEVDGKKPVEFDIEEELGIKEKNRERSVKLHATFKEELTGREQNATAMVTIHETPHKIEMEKSPDNFKPGLPFSVTAIVKYHDKNAPVSDDINPVNFTIKYYYDTPRTCQRRRYNNYYYDYHGIPTSTEDNSDDTTSTSTTTEEPIETYECRDEHSYEIFKQSPLSNGFSKIDIEIPSNTTRIDVIAKYLDNTGSLYYISRAASKSGQFIEISSAEGK